MTSIPHRVRLSDIDRLSIDANQPVDWSRVDALEAIYRADPPPVDAAIFNGRLVSVDDRHKVYALARISSGPTPVRVRVVENPRETTRLLREANGIEAEDVLGVPSARDGVDILEVLVTELARKRLGLPNDGRSDSVLLRDAAELLGWERCPCADLDLDAECAHCAGIEFLLPYDPPVDVVEFTIVPSGPPTSNARPGSTP